MSMFDECSDDDEDKLDSLSNELKSGDLFKYSIEISEKPDKISELLSPSQFLVLDG